MQNLGFECILGTLSFERNTPQPVQLDLTLELDFSKIAESENLNNSVDYVELSHLVKHFVQESKFLLIETLVFRVAKLILHQYANVLAVEVSVKKPRAIAPAIAVAEIRMER